MSPESSASPRRPVEHLAAGEVAAEAQQREVVPELVRRRPTSSRSTSSGRMHPLAVELVDRAPGSRSGAPTRPSSCSSAGARSRSRAGRRATRRTPPSRRAAAGSPRGRCRRATRRAARAARCRTRASCRCRSGPAAPRGCRRGACARTSSYVTHCWPSAGTYCRSSSQIGHVGGGSSDSGNCVPHVLQRNDGHRPTTCVHGAGRQRPLVRPELLCRAAASRIGCASDLVAGERDALGLPLPHEGERARAGAAATPTAFASSLRRRAPRSSAASAAARDGSDPVGMRRVVVAFVPSENWSAEAEVLAPSGTLKLEAARTVPAPDPAREARAVAVRSRVRSRCCRRPPQEWRARARPCATSAICSGTTTPSSFSGGPAHGKRL